MNLANFKSHEERVKVIEKWLDNEWSRKEQEMQYYIDNQKVESENNNNSKSHEIELKYSLKIGDLVFLSIPSLLTYAVIYLLPFQVTLFAVVGMVVVGGFISYKSLKE